MSSKTSTPARESFEANIAHRVELTGSKLLPGRSGRGATLAFSRRPLPRAYRPFIGPILKARLGSTSPVRRAVGQRPVFAPTCRPGRREPDDTRPFAINPAQPGKVTPLFAPPTPRRPPPRCQDIGRCSRAWYGPTEAAQRAGSWSADRSKTAWSGGWNGFRKRQDRDHFLDPGIHNPSILPDAQMGRRTNTAWEEKVFRRET